jgi:flagellar hook-associated protein 1 FlgK
MLDQFYTAWDDLASSPEDAGARESVVRVGVSLADTIRAVRSRLTDQQDAINGEINQTVDDANRVIRELQILNRNILTATAAGNLPGDMEDQRDTLIARLGELVGATGTIEDDGTAIVRIGGRVLVQLEAATEITYDPLRNVAPAMGGRELGAGDIDGKLGGLIEVRDEDLVTAVKRLDEFAYRLATDVNAVHEQGTDTYGNPAGPFFVLLDLEAGTADSAAGRIRVAATLQDDSRRIAAGATTAPGDNSIALDIAALRNDSFGASGMLDALVVDVGARAREAKDLALGQEVIVNSFKAQRESVSGVSLDEEAANLLRFQRSYEAAARLMTIADEMAETVLAI